MRQGVRAESDKTAWTPAGLGQTNLARVLIGAVLTALAVLFLWLTIQVDLVLFGGLLLAAFLCNTARCLAARTGMRHDWSLIIVVLLIGATLFGLIWLFASTIAGQIGLLSQRLPADLNQVVDKLWKVPIARTAMAGINEHSIVTAIESKLGDIAGYAWTAVEAVAGGVIILFVGLYVAVDVAPYRRGLLSLVPPDRRARVAAILEEAAETLWYWMLGRLFAMSVLGVLTGIGLWLIGVPAPLSLGLLAALLTFVPYIGAFVSAIPSIILAMVIDTPTAIDVIGLYIAIHAIEGYVLVPLVQRRVTHLPPALGLAGQLILGVVAGLLGLLFATPLLLALIVLVRAFYIEDTLGDSMPS